jgi:hypothetical protein
MGNMVGTRLLFAQTSASSEIPSLTDSPVHEWCSPRRRPLVKALFVPILNVSMLTDQLEKEKCAHEVTGNGHQADAEWARPMTA